jgi:predicted transcriptional regulator
MDNTPIRGTMVGQKGPENEANQVDPEGRETGEKELILHPDRQGLRMVLGDLEAELMEVIWREPEGTWCTVRDVYETLRDERRIAYTTVMNTMTRLAKKGVLESRRQDMAYLYCPRQSREAFIHGVVGHVLERLLLHFTGPTQTGLRDYAASHPEEAGKVSRLIGEIATRRAGKPARSKDQRD